MGAFLSRGGVVAGAADPVAKLAGRVVAPGRIIFSAVAAAMQAARPMQGVT